MKLTEKTVQAAKAAGIPKKLFDGHGLYLHITKTGRKWRYTYRLNGKPKEFTIGDANIISLSEARKKHHIARLLVLEGEDPVDQRKHSLEIKRVQKERERVNQIPTGRIIDDWFEKCSLELANSHSSKIKSRLDNHIPDWFRNKPIVDVKPVDIVSIYNQSAKVSENLVHKIRSYLRRSFDAAVSKEIIPTNPVRHPMADEAVPKKRSYKKLPHIKQPDLIGDVLRKIDNHSGNPNVSAALKLLPYVFTRPGELRNMQWREVEFENRLWRIPHEKMKGRREHLVPLSDQALEILVKHFETPSLRLAQDPEFDFVFPGRNINMPFSDMSLGKAMKSVGISSDLLVPHGWRHTASSAINERLFELDGEKIRFSPDAVEIQLAHALPGIRGTYNSAEYLDERRRMLQAWAIWLDSLRNPSEARYLDTANS